MSINEQFDYTIEVMSNISDRKLQLKRYARLVLGLFVLSVMNMGIQIPSHAVMLHTMAPGSEYVVQAHQHQAIEHKMDMLSCECPPVLCESVASLGDPLIDSLQMVSFSRLTGFRAIYITAVEDNHHQASTRLSLRDRLYRQSSPPPLRITSILHI
ncbi:hypothetical protein MNBD_GAMMA11-3013 [hydrothermal vent metagenome]|uniref:Uncharacterized protein n=1 Tax=hydrothermal vent metagenome TaxID=652676 RepID=A0A3B0X687_9ZZZZ